METVERKGKLLHLLIAAILACSVAGILLPRQHAEALTASSGDGDAGSLSATADGSGSEDGYFAASVNFAESEYSACAKTAVTWDDSWLYQSSSEYNHQLAVVAAAASLYAYSGTGELLAQSLGSFGFSVVESHYPTSSDYAANPNDTAYVISSKTLSDGTVAIAVIVRGTGNNTEWLSNVNISDSDTWNTANLHEGFNSAADKVVNTLSNCANGYDKSKVKILVAGHSRGAGIANLIGYKLDNGALGSEISSDDVFDYTFESPTVSKDASAQSSNYGNIFNIVNPEDIVTEVPLTGWGYYRYGTDLVLPSKSNTSRSVYAQKYAAMNSIFQSYTGTSYQNYAEGSLAIADVTSQLAELVPDMSDYYHPDSGTSLNNFTKALVDATLMGIVTSDDQAYLLGCITKPPVLKFLTTIFGIESIDLNEGKVNIAVPTRVWHGHICETPLSWLQSTSSGDELFAGSYRRVTITGPVDVYGYDSNGDLIVKIVGGIVDQTVMANGLAAYVDSDGTARIDVPYGDACSIKITPTGEGEMDFTVQDMSATGNPGKTTQYGGVKVGTTQSFSCSIATGISVVRIKLNELDEAGATVSEAVSDSLIRTDDPSQQTVSIQVKSAGNGYAWAPSTALTGSEVRLHAAANTGGAFLGWYDETGALVSTAANLTVRPTENVTYIAKFTDAKPHQMFTDLGVFDWYLLPTAAFSDGTLYLDFVLERGIMSGYAGTTHFGPYNNITRAEFATMLFRYACPDEAYMTKDENSYATENTTKLDDVKEGEFYTAAVNWAVENGIITGYKNDAGSYVAFGPNDSITREQLATMVYRFCTVYKGLDDVKTTALPFPDSSDISVWAIAGVRYCYAKGIVSGDSSTSCFYPNDPAQRCAAAKMMAVMVHDVVEG